MPQFNLDEYVDVQTRITKFWSEHKDGAIRTYLVSPEGNFDICRYKAEVYKDRNHELPDATGYAFEIAGKGMANQTSHEENAETSAIGRALANMGYATSSKDRPSRQEMEKVARHTQAPKPASKATTVSLGDSPDTTPDGECSHCGKHVPGKSVYWSNKKFGRTLCWDDQEAFKNGELGDPKNDIRPESVMDAYGGER